MSIEIGKAGEEIAGRILRKEGYRLLERNYRSRFGEIDIIAKKEGCLIFVEVKYKKDMGFGLPQEAVTKGKLAKIVKTAEIYLSEKKAKGDWRIDVIAIESDSGKYDIFENVFTFGLA